VAPALKIGSQTEVPYKRRRGKVGFRPSGSAL
jgi:hypothetical protein